MGDVSARLVDLPVAQQRGPEHVQAPGLHRQVADLAEDRQRLAELVDAIAGHRAEVAVVAEPPDGIPFAPPVADAAEDVARLFEVPEPDVVRVGSCRPPRPIGETAYVNEAL